MGLPHSTPIYGRFNGQNERIFGPGGAWPPLPMPAYALAVQNQKAEISGFVPPVAHKK